MDAYIICYDVLAFFHANGGLCVIHCIYSFVGIVRWRFTMDSTKGTQSRVMYRSFPIVGVVDVDVENVLGMGYIESAEQNGRTLLIGCIFCQ